MNRAWALACLAVLGFAGAGAALPLPSYEIATLGLTDPDHTWSGGRYFSVVEFLNESGYAVGVSSRFVGAGLSTWVFDSSAGTNTRVGLFDAEHTRSDEYQFSRPSRQSNSTLAGGYSLRFGDAGELGESAWVYDAATTTTHRVGYFDTEHTRSDGFQLSYLSGLAASGAAGYSVRYLDSSPHGYSAWLFDPDDSTTTRLGQFDGDFIRGDGYQAALTTTVLTNSGYVGGWSAHFGGANPGTSGWIYDSGGATYTEVGLFDAAHTRGDGLRGSVPEFLLESGSAAGRSYLGGDGSLGQSAWVYDRASASTARVGYFDADHTGADGYQFSSLMHFTETGYAGGHSTRFAGGQEGQSAWIYDSAGGTLSRLGLIDPDHTDSFGLQYSELLQGTVTDSGDALGSSWRFVGGGGSSVWVYEGSDSSTTRVGLFDVEHTGSDGSQHSIAGKLTNSGFAVGESTRFGGGESLGVSAWLYDGNDGSVTKLGLFDATHTRSDGVGYSSAYLLTESGYAAGNSIRFSGADEMGYTAWIYDASSETQYSIVLSQAPSGYAASNVSVLTEDGLALGSYAFFDEAGYRGDHAFAWTAEQGAIDLGALIDGGLDPAFWENLQRADATNRLRQVVGVGRLQSGSFFSYLLTPVPEASAFSLVAAALAVFGVWSLSRR